MRLPATVLFCLHLGIGTAGTALDARFEARSTDQAHFESERAATCAPGHAHDVCVLCRSETIPVAPAARALLWVTAVARSATQLPLDIMPARPALSAGGGPRAPPLS